MKNGHDKTVLTESLTHLVTPKNRALLLEALICDTVHISHTRPYVRYVPVYKLLNSLLAIWTEIEKEGYGGTRSAERDM
jgi:hypothetical protein